MAKTCLYFIVGNVPTEDEKADASRLVHQYSVLVRSTVHDTTFGGRLEPADAVAGAVPQAYLDGIAQYPDGNVTPAPDDEPEEQNIIPDVVPPIASGTDFQLYGTTAEYDEASKEVKMTDRTSGAGITWETSDDAVATVSADGLVGGVAAGSATITWTYEYEPGSTVTASRDVTVT